MVGEYQVKNLPCPQFAESEDVTDRELKGQLRAPLRHGRVDEVVAMLRPHLETPPFRLAIRDAIVGVAKRIIAIERERGEISREPCSALDPAAQPYQDLIDRLLYAMAGLTAEESAALEQRLEMML